MALVDMVQFWYMKKRKSLQKELSGGFNNTTNNRMELMAVIAALEALKDLVV